MGGKHLRFEPESFGKLYADEEALEIFTHAGWTTFFKCLCGFDVTIATEFASRFQGTHATIRGLQFPVNVGTVAKVAGLPQIGDLFFPTPSTRVTDLKPHKKQFLQRGESVENVQGQGVARKSLPEPWDSVAKFLIHYITCEGSFKYVFAHHFCLMLHLRYDVLVNFPYYLFCSLKRSYDQNNQRHANSLAHHGLIKLIVNHNLRLAQPTLDWDAFVNQTL